MKVFLLILLLQDVLVLPKVTYPGKGIFLYSEIKDVPQSASAVLQLRKRLFSKKFNLNKYTNNHYR
jgi:hypothetical protein